MIREIENDCASVKCTNVYLIRAVAGQRSSPDLCFATKATKSMTKDIDLNVTQVGRDGTA